MDATPLPGKILQTWQRIEFFQPHLLEKKEKCLYISLKQLINERNNSLPWHSDKLYSQYEIPRSASFILYLGLFGNNTANQISQQVFGPDEGTDAEEREQRLNEEGTTCFAKVYVNAEGVPELDKLSISSLPWALGHLQNQRFSHLESTLFSTDCKRLADTLNTFKTTLKPIRQDGPGVLSTDDILTLLMTHLTGWADFIPEWQYAVRIEWFEGKSTKQETRGEEQTEEESDDKENALTLPILNSFYFEDLEFAIASLKNKPCKTLNSWLSRKSESERNPDLYSQAGLSAIIDNLHPGKTPSGRWPSEPGHSMSLMQQFAINTAVTELAEGGLLSVNGPPGTGKTTLLRDLIACNIVERAKVLANFKDINQTLDPEGFIVPELTGYEMIIASSNNAAVENISKELPQKKSLAKEFDTADYLMPVANQIAAKYHPKRERKEVKNAQGEVTGYYHLFQPIDDQNQCWGLISAALGKKGNRENFIQRFFFGEHFLRNTAEENHRPDCENFLNLWRWKKTSKRLSFTEAKNHFLRSLGDNQQQQKQLAEFARLLNEQPFNLPDMWSAALTEAETRREEYSSQLKQAEADRDMNEKQVRHTALEQKLIESKAPGWLSRLLKRKKVRSYQQSLDRVQQQLLALTAALAENARLIASKRKQLNEAEATIRELQQKIDAITRQIAQKKQKLAELQKKFHGVAIPDKSQPITDANLQRTAFWQNAQINRLRSELFLAAVNLHQAWLYETMELKHFKAMLCKLSHFLSSPHQELTPIRYWQTLSMVVPVLSTTFASVGRMLRGVKSEEIGWLMIDEAGQASPQQAAGAILRAKRVLIVGDPLQIEPVFTTSPALVKRLCKDILQEQAEEWDPGKQSVQQIADRSNPWGCELEVMDNKIWVGAPLWVHRRCIEPMFSIANALAYNNRMIHGLNADKICSQTINCKLENHWLVAKGGRGEKQYRDSHGKSLVSLLDRLLSEGVALESVYIITPFKAVRYALFERLEQRPLKSWQQYSPMLKRKNIDEWLKHCLGTVHTFQGKENDIVIFVLGCDTQNNGGAVWASGKPNLLNVAITRAKKHIFVIGDPDVWGNLRGFDKVAMMLSQKTPCSTAVSHDVSELNMS